MSSEATVINTTTVETENNLSSERQSSGGFLNIPITAVKTKENSFIVDKCKNEDNICQMRLKDTLGNFELKFGQLFAAARRIGSM